MMLNLRKYSNSGRIEISSSMWADELMGEDLKVTALIFLNTVKRELEYRQNLLVDESSLSYEEKVLNETDEGIQVSLYIAVTVDGFRSDEEWREVCDRVFKQFFESKDYGVRTLKLYYELQHPEYIPELGTLT